MRTLELAPQSPFHDLPAFVQKLKAFGVDVENQNTVNQAVKKALTGYKPRHDRRVVHLYGADIMTETPETLAVWPLITPPEQARIRAHPVTGGAAVEPGDPTYRQMELASRLDRHQVNRSVLISLQGLKRTYVWRKDCGTWNGLTGWFQEVEDADYDLIMGFPENRRMFANPEVSGPYVPVRSYDGPVRYREESKSLKDVEYMLRQTSSKGGQWGGVALKEA